MCGIAGILTRRNPPDPDALRRMASVLGHRGPDASGIYRDPERLLRADVPVGCYVSGGLDSSVIAALAHHHAERPIPRTAPRRCEFVCSTDLSAEVP